MLSCTTVTSSRWSRQRASSVVTSTLRTTSAHMSVPIVSTRPAKVSSAWERSASAKLQPLWHLQHRVRQSRRISCRHSRNVCPRPGPRADRRRSGRPAAGRVRPDCGRHRSRRRPGTVIGDYREVAVLPCVGVRAAERRQAPRRRGGYRAAGLLLSCPRAYAATCGVPGVHPYLGTARMPG